MMMIHNASIFASYGLDKILDPFIEAQGVSNELSTELAQKALLKWTECQGSAALGDNARARKGEVYEVITLEMPSSVIYLIPRDF